jgi:hypothetical protein
MQVLAGEVGLGTFRRSPRTHGWVVLDVLLARMNCYHGQRSAVRVAASSMAVRGTVIAEQLKIQSPLSFLESKTKRR